MNSLSLSDWISLLKGTPIADSVSIKLSSSKALISYMIYKLSRKCSFPDTQWKPFNIAFEGENNFKTNYPDNFPKNSELVDSILG